MVASRDAVRLTQAVASDPALGIVPLDVTSEAAARSALVEVVERLGGLDILVNSAGILSQVGFVDAAAAATAEIDVAVNLVGSMRMTRLALPYLKRSPDGAVVFLSSALALTAAPGVASVRRLEGRHPLVRPLAAGRACRAGPGV